MISISRGFGGWAARGITGAVLLAVQGCAQAVSPVVAPAPRYYAVDLQGKAKSCIVPALLPQDGRTTAMTMAVGNDGGWCSITVTQRDVGPYSAGLLSDHPAHGTIYVHTVGADTRIDYTPNRGYAGSDSFTVTLLPGAAELKVAVTVGPA